MSSVEDIPDQQAHPDVVTNCYLFKGKTWPCWKPHPVKDAVDSDQRRHVEAAELEVFKIACEHFRHDISSFWIQANFFVLVQAALFSFFIAAIGPQDEPRSPGLIRIEIEVLVTAIAGALFAVLWLLVSHGRRKFIDKWRDAVMHMDGVVDPHGVFLVVEKRAHHDMINPINLTTYVPLILTLCWLAGVVWAVSRLI